MRSTFIRPVRVSDIGMGALYFFASHMVIRSMFYVGADRSPQQIALFLVLVMASFAAVHMAPEAFLALRLKASEYVKAPIVSVLATIGALLELFAILPVAGTAVFYAGAVLVGVSCGWLVVIWMSSFRVTAPDPATFALEPDLIAAVGFYFGFRVASSVSAGVAEGFLLALPLVAIACMLVEPAPCGCVVGPGDGALSDDGDDRGFGDRGFDDQGPESRRASMVLVCVSAVFALLSSVLVHVAGKDGLALSSGVNYMVLFEMLLTAVVLGCCYLLFWLAAQRPRPRGTAVFATVLLCVPTACVGLAMGAAYEPDDVASLMWEVSFWVMLVAVFAYDLRQTLYLGRGLAVGLMFEAMCMGQIAMQLMLHVGGGLWTQVAAPLLLAAYLAGVARQLLGGRRGRGEADYRNEVDCRSGVGASDTVTYGAGGEKPAPGLAAASGSVALHAAPGQPGRDAPDESDALTRRCRELGAPFGLTASEVRILVQVAHGRSARYIADDLGLSFNTVRTHIRHVYEKLGIHSKQELIDLVDREG